MINQRELQISNIIKSFQGDDFCITEFQKASDTFEELIKSGKTKHRGNQVASTAHLTNAPISYNQHKYIKY